VRIIPEYLPSKRLLEWNALFWECFAISFSPTADCKSTFLFCKKLIGLTLHQHYRPADKPSVPASKIYCPTIFFHTFHNTGNSYPLSSFRFGQSVFKMDILPARIFHQNGKFLRLHLNAHQNIHFFFPRFQTAMYGIFQQVS